MKVKADSKTLKLNLQMAANAAVQGDKVGACWTGLRLRAKEGQLEITGGNPEGAVVTRMEADVSEEGEVLTSVKVLEDLAGYLDEGKTSIDEGKGFLDIRCGDLRMKSPVLKEEYPPVPDALPKGGVEIELKQLQDAIASVSVHAGKKANMPILEGIRLEFFPEGNPILLLTAADGFRLGTIAIPMQKVQESLKGKDVVIPAAMLKQILGKCPSEGKIQVVLQDGKVLIGNANLVISMAALSGQYPAVKALIPKTSKVRAAVNLALFIRNLRFGRMVNEHGEINLQAGNKKNYITLRNEGNQTGASEAKVESSAEGVSTDVYLNLQYLKEAVESVRMLGYSGVELSTEGGTLPMKVLPVRDEEHKSQLEAVFLVLPCRKPNAQGEQQTL